MIPARIDVEPTLLIRIKHSNTRAFYKPDKYKVYLNFIFTCFKYLSKHLPKACTQVPFWDRDQHKLFHVHEDSVVPVKFLFQTEAQSLLADMRQVSKPLLMYHLKFFICNSNVIFMVFSKQTYSWT